MRISDWSSDVCSSDLIALDPLVLHPNPRRLPGNQHARWIFQRPVDRRVVGLHRPIRTLDGKVPVQAGDVLLRIVGHRIGAHHDRRSEEHTSELQSLMRISYAVFCLKKKKYRHTIKTDDDKETIHNIPHTHFSVQTQ